LKVSRQPDGFGYEKAMATEVNLTRTLNAVYVTLNDQKHREFDAERVQQIANGATGGEMEFAAYGNGTSGELREGSLEGRALAKVSLAKGKWSVERVPEARKSRALEQSERERSEKIKIEHQKPVRGRLAIWKKRLSGS